MPEFLQICSQWLCRSPLKSHIPFLCDAQISCPAILKVTNNLSSAFLFLKEKKEVVVRSKYNMFHAICIMRRKFLQLLSEATRMREAGIYIYTCMSSSLWILEQNVAVEDKNIPSAWMGVNMTDLDANLRNNAYWIIPVQLLSHGLNYLIRLLLRGNHGDSGKPPCMLP